MNSLKLATNLISGFRQIHHSPVVGAIQSRVINRFYCEQQTRENDGFKVLYVGNIPYRITPRDIAGFFKAFTTVQHVKMIFDRETRKPAGFCFIQVANEHVSGALEADGTMLFGRPVRVSEATDPHRSIIREGEPVITGEEPEHVQPEEEH